MIEYKEVKFTSYQLLVNESYAEAKLFEKINEAWNQDYEDEKGTIHNVRCSFKEGRFFTFYDNYGSPNPRPELIYDKQTKTKILNPRANYQAELKSQLFCLYDTQYKILYFNNSRKNIFIQKYLQNILSQEVIIKRIFKNIDEFVNTLKTIDKITFIAHRNIFSNSVDSFKGIKDVFGIDEPESFTIEANYNLTANEQVKRVLERFRKEQVQLPNSCLTCVGRDDNGIEQIFNEDSFSKSFTVLIQENSEHLLNPVDVFDALIRKIL